MAWLVIFKGVFQKDIGTFQSLRSTLSRACAQHPYIPTIFLRSPDLNLKNNLAHFVGPGYVRKRFCYF